jgi:trans-2,3-dihydro-3-hydroxyanthranilate isomerase
MSTRTYRYLHLDVFTDTIFEGNQLAVFPEPAGLTDAEMQTIAREMNFSESTFVFPPETPGTDVRMRIFTPGEELPMAGHPVIGSTFALVKEKVIAPGRETFVFGLGVGPTPVSLAWTGSALDFAWMTQKNPEVRGRVAAPDAFAAAIGVEAGDLADTPPEVISCGVPFLIAALKTRRAVDAVTLDLRAYTAVLRGSGIDNVPLFVFTTEVGAERSPHDHREPAARETHEVEAAYSRMLAPGFGISEDPATGSASGPLGCYLHAHRLIDRARLSHVVSLQGRKMLRPSRIHISLDARGDTITRVRVGGGSVLVGEGTLTL